MEEKTVRPYKQGLSIEGGRRRRDHLTLQIRKHKKDEQIAKRRNQGPKPPISVNDQTNNDRIQEKKTISMQELYGVVSYISNSNNADQSIIAEKIRSVRRLLSVEKNAPFEEVIASGILPLLVQYLQERNHPEVQFESAWALTNIASSQYTRDVFNAGAVTELVGLLKSNDPQVREQSAWCLSNIAGECPLYRDAILNCGGLDGLLLNLQHGATNIPTGNFVWAISNLCRGTPKPDLKLLRPALPYLVNVLQQTENEEVLIDAMWALSYVNDGPEERIQAVLDSGVLPVVTMLLERRLSSMVLTAIVRCLGNFTSGNEQQTQAVIDGGFLNHSKMLLANTKKRVRKETCWLMSNIAAGTKEQVATLFGKKAGLHLVVEYAKGGASWEVQKEALWCIANVLTSGSDRHVAILAQAHGIAAMVHGLSFTDTTVVKVCLDALEHVLKVGQRTGISYYEDIDECDGIDKLEQLQEHGDEGVYQKAVLIIEKYIGTADDYEDENLAPMSLGDTFAFGIASKQLFTEDENMEGNDQMVFAVNNAANGT